MREIWLLRLRMLLARANGDDASYRDYRDRYRETATSLGFEGHMKWAEAMPHDGRSAPQFMSFPGSVVKLCQHNWSGEVIRINVETALTLKRA